MYRCSTVLPGPSYRVHDPNVGNEYLIMTIIMQCANLVMRRIYLVHYDRAMGSWYP